MLESREVSEEIISRLVSNAEVLRSVQRWIGSDDQGSAWLCHLILHTLADMR